MPQLPEQTPVKHTHRRRSSSWLRGKFRRIRKSKRAKRAFIQQLVMIAALLIAFSLGFYFFGPSFTTSGE